MNYKFSGEVWLYNGLGAWHFITLPKNIAKEIKFNFGSGRLGWGSMPVSVKIKGISWETSIFPDKQSGSYLLPIKAVIREKASISIGDKPTVYLTLNL